MIRKIVNLLHKNHQTPLSESEAVHTGLEAWTTEIRAYTIKTPVDANLKEIAGH
jgi:hypothetical protein